MGKYFKYIDDDIRVQYLCDQHPESKNFATHTHEHCELYIFLGGKGVCKIEGNSYPMEIGDIFIIRPSECHYMDIDSSSPYERIVIHFRKNSLPIDLESKLFDAFYKRQLGKQNQYPKNLFKPEIYSYIIQNLTEKNEYEHLQFITNASVLLYEISKIFHSNRITTSREQTLVNQIINYVDANLDTSISFEDICRKYLINKTKLYRVFKESTGTSIHNYILIKRLTNAKIDLELGIPPTRVALLNGYTDYSSFYRAFTKHFGASPKDIYKKVK